MLFLDYYLSLLFVWSIKDVYTRFQTIIGKIFTANRIHEHFLVNEEGYFKCDLVEGTKSN